MPLLDINLISISYSLNYDLLLELSAASIGYNPDYNGNTGNNKLPLLKIHGSSNFWPDIGTNQFIGCTFENNGTDFDAPINALNQEETLHKCKTENSLAPAMSMFAKGKEVRVCADGVKQTYNIWKETVNKASKIFIIGVRVHEVDAHIWDVLGKSKAKITYFGFEADKIEFNTWKNNHNKRNAYFQGKNFKNAIPVIKKQCLQ